MSYLSEWHATILTPISKKTPVGDDCRLSESFELLQEEVSNDLAMDRGATDWQRVSTLSTQILDTQSKDLLVMVYGFRALAGVQGYAGFAESVSVLNLYLKHYWLTGFPLLKRKRAREGALEWLTQQLTDWVESNEPADVDRPHVEVVLAGLPELNRQLGEFEGDWYLDCSAIVRLLNGYLASLPATPITLDRSQPEQTSHESDGNAKQLSDSAEIVPIRSSSLIEASGAPTNRSNTHIAQPQEPLTDQKMIQHSVRQAQTSLKALAKQRLAGNLYDPMAYDINRFSLWLPVVELPQHKSSITPLRPVPIEKRAFFQTLFQQQQFSALVIEVENSLSSSPFWLDGHRMVVEALEASESAASKQSQSAINLISVRLAEFISRFGGIEQLCFSDKTPFADSETLRWIDDIKHLAQPQSNNEQPRNGSMSFKTALQAPDDGIAVEQNDSLLTRQEQALLRDVSNAQSQTGFTSGLQILENYTSQTNCQRTWFRGRLLTAQHCMDAKEMLLAEHVLMQLDDVVLLHQLEAWEPALATEMLAMMLTCKTLLKRKQESGEYYRRLASINIIKSYEMKSHIE